MADLHNILAKFTELGIENKGLTVDGAPTQPNASTSSSSEDVSPEAHAAMINESLANKHIPGVSDVSATDFAALAGVAPTTSNTSQPVSPKMEVSQKSYQNTPNYTEIENRLDKIERTLEKVFEAVEKLNQPVSEEFYTTDLTEALQEAKKSKGKKKPVPTKPDKWSYAKSQAKEKFDVYPSAYANAWAAKKYKELGGGWRMGKK